MDGEAKAIRRVITSPDLLTAYTNPMGRRYNLDRPGREVVRQAARTMLEHAPIGLILSMPDDDNENWRTLIDTAATEYADEINPNMLGLIAQAEGNNQTKTILGERLGKDALSGTDENQTPTASPEPAERTDSTCDCSDGSRPTSTISSDHPTRRNTCGQAAWTRR